MLMFMLMLHVYPPIRPAAARARARARAPVQRTIDAGNPTKRWHEREHQLHQQSVTETHSNETRRARMAGHVIACR